MLSRAIAGLIGTLSHMRHPGGIIGLILLLALATPSAADDVHDRWGTGQASSDVIFTAAQDDGDEELPARSPMVVSSLRQAAPRIAFDSTRSGNVEIYIMNIDGSGVTNLTNHAAEDSDPAWSPDGTRIAFESFRDGNYAIYVMNADGSSLRRLTSDAESSHRAPAWSPDGTRIAFHSYRAGGHDIAGTHDIYVMNADGSRVINLTNSPWADDDSPNWSADGTRIAFESNRLGNADIYIMNADGSGVTILTRDQATDSHPVFSPP